VIGPLLAGGALALFGMVSCFSLNGLSFMVVIVALMSLGVNRSKPFSRRQRAVPAQIPDRDPDWHPLQTRLNHGFSWLSSLPGQLVGAAHEAIHQLHISWVCKQRDYNQSLI
jgi:hypothetical protein